MVRFSSLPSLALNRSGLWGGGLQRRRTCQLSKLSMVKGVGTVERGCPKILLISQ